MVQLARLRTRGEAARHGGRSGPARSSAPRRGRLAFAHVRASIRAMASDPLVVLVVAAVIGGLVAFAVLLLAGVGVVRWLRLPQELPEIPRFEPPPPPLRAHPDRAAARAVAARQAELRQLFARGLGICQATQQCQEMLGAVEGLSGLDGALRDPALAELRRSSATSAGALTVADQALRQLDEELRGAPAADAAPIPAIAATAAIVDQQALAAQGALASARAAVQALPDLTGRRRLWLMLALLAVMVAWVAAMALITRR